jgi:hypothetical protein
VPALTASAFLDTADQLHPCRQFTMADVLSPIYSGPGSVLRYSTDKFVINRTVFLNSDAAPFKSNY